MATESIEQQLIRFIAIGLRSGITRLELIHCTAKRDDLLEDYHILPNTTEAADAAGEVLSTVNMMMEFYRIPQRLAIQSFIASNDIVFGRHEFMAPPGAPARGSSAMGTEPHVERGLLGQLMRHTEAAYAANTELARHVAIMHKARAAEAETVVNRYVAERQRNAGLRAEEAQRAHQQKVVEEEAEREYELVRMGIDELAPILRSLSPHLARRLGRWLDGSSKRGAPPPPPFEDEASAEGTASGEPPPGQAQRAKEDIERQAAPAEPQERDTLDARRARLQAVLSKLSEEDAAGLEKALGTERAQSLVRAMVDLLR